MAATSSIMATGEAARRGDESKGSKRRAAGMVAIAALGLSLAAGGAFGHERLAARHDAPPANAIPFASDAHVYTIWDFREDHRVAFPAVADLPSYRESHGLDGSTFVPDQFTSREDHRVVVPAIDFGPVECGAAPCISAPAFVPDQFTYREDHRVR
jgi:hypothetical protein